MVQSIRSSTNQMTEDVSGVDRTRSIHTICPNVLAGIWRDCMMGMTGMTNMMDRLAMWRLVAKLHSAPPSAFRSW